jgi:hypothetical protein
MKTPNRRILLALSLIWLALSPIGNLGCSDDGSGLGKEFKPFVGKWRAESMVLTNVANPTVSVDLVEEGATFTLSILATGQYSASLSAFGQTNTEVGMIQVSGNQITIAPTSPAGPPIIATFAFDGELLVLDGTSEFDFNLDGIAEASTVHIELYALDS